MCVTKLFPCRSVLLLEPNPGDATARLGPKTYVLDSGMHPPQEWALWGTYATYTTHKITVIGWAIRLDVAWSVCNIRLAAVTKLTPPPVSVHCNAASHITLDSFIVFTVCFVFSVFLSFLCWFSVFLSDLFSVCMGLVAWNKTMEWNGNYSCMRRYWLNPPFDKKTP